LPNLTFPKSALEPRPSLPAGTIQVIFTGFKPKLSAKKEGKDQSVNLNPELKIVNDSRQTPDGKPLNGQKVFESLNLSFMPRLQDFFHAFGCAMEGEDATDSEAPVTLPGYFDNEPVTTAAGWHEWGQYHGPALNEIATLELVEVPSRKSGAKATDTQTDIKRYLCRVPGCQVKHLETLIRS
jgi:hypothetical protein